MDGFCVLLVMIFIQLHIFVKAHQAKDVKWFYSVMFK